MTTQNKLIQLTGLASVCLGSLTICGYIVGNPDFYTWSLGIPMPLNSAIGFVALGTAVFLIGRQFKNLNKKT